MPENHVEFSKEIISQRAEYGLHKIDTYSLDRYLAIVLSNALTVLAEGVHGWPGTEEYDTTDGFDKWVSDIRYHAETFRLYAESDDRSWINHDSIHWPEEDLDTTPSEFSDRVNNPSPEYSEAMDKWIKLDDTDYKITKERMDAAFEWLTKWWGGLWD